MHYKDTSIELMIDINTRELIRLNEKISVTLGILLVAMIRQMNFFFGILTVEMLEVV